LASWHFNLIILFANGLYFSVSVCKTPVGLIIAPNPSLLMENPLPLKRSCFSQYSQQEQMDVFSRTGK